MSGGYLLLTFIVAIVVMIVAISRFKVHPFLAIMGVSLILAIVLGLPLQKIPDIIGQGFSSTFTSIGLVIILGGLIGAILEQSGAALKMAESVDKTIGRKHPELAMMIMGFIVSIPVFCDSGFVIMNPIRKSICRRTGVSSVTMTVALSCGLFCSHVFIPPTPGPIAAAGFLGMDNHLILIIVMGCLVSIPCLAVAYFFSRSIGRKVSSVEESSTRTDDADTSQPSEDEVLLPSAFASFAPIVIPILLMALGSIVSLTGNPTAGYFKWCIFLGKPLIALLIGFLCAVILLARSGKGNQLLSITDSTLKIVGPILFITAAGGVLGKVIIEAGLIEYIRRFSGMVSSIGIFFPFLIAAILKSAQGSSTVAITTTASIMGMFSDEASLMTVLGLNTPYLATLGVLAIGAGAMTVSHANDSYFWVVTNFGGIKTQDGYRTQTLATLLMGITAILTIAVLSLI
ncbi:MAG: GntP family permease [Bacteroidales bacterium]|nr:GntP family permease [Bacteroidales bacterium]